MFDAVGRFFFFYFVLYSSEHFSLLSKQSFLFFFPNRWNSFTPKDILFSSPNQSKCNKFLSFQEINQPLIRRIWYFMLYGDTLPYVSFTSAKIDYSHAKVGTWHFGATAPNYFHFSFHKFAIMTISPFLSIYCSSFYRSNEYKLSPVVEILPCLIRICSIC